MFRILITTVLLLLCSPAVAQQPSLIGVWKLTSFVVEEAQTKERRNSYGEKPAGDLIITPERLMVVITAEGRKPPQTDADRAQALQTMFAYTGPYRLEGDRIVTKVEVSWNESWTGTEQTRLFRVQGDKLYLETLTQPAVNRPGRLIRSFLEWQRSN